MVGKVIENHWVGRVDGVSLGEKLHSVLDSIMCFAVQFQDSQAHQCTYTLRVELKGSLKGHPKMLKKILSIVIEVICASALIFSFMNIQLMLSFTHYE